MVSRSTLWQIMWYTCAALCLATAAGYAILDAPMPARALLVLGAAMLQYVSRSTRRHRRAVGA